MSHSEEDDDPLEADMDDVCESVDLDECPYCHAAVYHMAEVCPKCKSYISEEDAPARRKPWWIIVGVVLVLGAMLLSWVFRIRWFS